MAQITHMPAAEKRRLEQENLKQSRIDHIIECTFGLFADKGIESISMNEIASQSEIGVASLYRYFSTKEDLAIECAIYAWKMEEENFRRIFTSEKYAQLTGLEQVQELLGIFPEAFVSQSSFFRFVYYFDSFVRKERVSPERLEKYEKTIGGVNQIVLSALAKGKKDGSITFNAGRNAAMETADPKELYFTVMHMLFSLAQKLSLSGEMLYMDKEIRPEKQLDLMVRIVLDALR